MWGAQGKCWRKSIVITRHLDRRQAFALYWEQLLDLLCSGQLFSWNILLGTCLRQVILSCMSQTCKLHAFLHDRAAAKLFWFNILFMWCYLRLFYYCGGKSNRRDWKIAQKDLSLFSFCGQLKMHGFKRMLIFSPFLCVIVLVLCVPPQVWFMPQSCCVRSEGDVCSNSSLRLYVMTVWWKSPPLDYFLKTLKQTINQGPELIWKLL